MKLILAALFGVKVSFVLHFIGNEWNSTQNCALYIYIISPNKKQLLARLLKIILKVFYAKNELKGNAEILLLGQG